MAVLDILGDGSCLAHYALEKDVTDTGDRCNGTSVRKVGFVNRAGSPSKPPFQRHRPLRHFRNFILRLSSGVLG
jgi:hypothetical protein